MISAKDKEFQSNSFSEICNNEKILFSIVKTTKSTSKDNFSEISNNEKIYNPDLFIKYRYFSSRYNHQIECQITSFRKFFNFNSFTIKQTINKTIIRMFRKYLKKSNLKNDLLQVKIISDFISKKISPPFRSEYHYEYFLYDHDEDIEKYNIEMALSGKYYQNKVYYKTINTSYITWLFGFKAFYILFTIFIHESFEIVLEKLMKYNNLNNSNDLYFYIKNFQDIYKNIHLFS